MDTPPLLVRDIMTQDVVTFSKDVSLEQAWGVMATRHFHAVPIISQDRKIVGIISESDFLTKGQLHLHLPSFIDVLKKSYIPWDIPYGQKELMEKVLLSRVEDIMTIECLTVRADMPLREAIAFFTENHLKTIPVTDEAGTLVGIVTISDIMQRILESSTTSLLKKPV